ncbi:hypothetical protein Scep_018649 [Stephania cephalantha]|uniref:Gfo/Idh/MocA-like oxidoreductase N-terminal domain-containing protein n=1 Tax=Stephania cephalantha TaxID=152367 RepID=A0AAP0NME2_9MAGN
MGSDENLEKIKIGILGCADVARKVSRAIKLSPNATVRAIGSRSGEKARRYAAENGFPAEARVYGSYEEVVEDGEVEAVYVPLPTSMHEKWAVAAAERGKHVLLEKPAAMDAAEVGRVVEACERNGVQFMDGTMWMHHPRTSRMRELMDDPDLFGHLKSVHVVYTFDAGTEFLKNNIRVKPDLDGLGVLGDIGWYCIRSILWAANYELPNRVLAIGDPVKHDAGTLLACGASLQWGDGKVATFHCSFLGNLAMDSTAVGTKGTLRVHDFVIPFEETSAAFTFGSNSRYNDLVTGWASPPVEHVVKNEVPQEVYMVKEFANLVGKVKDGGKPEKKWADICMVTQIVMDAVKESIDKGCEPVEIVSN